MFHQASQVSTELISVQSVVLILQACNAKVASSTLVVTKDLFFALRGEPDSDGRFLPAMIFFDPAVGAVYQFSKPMKDACLL